MFEVMTIKPTARGEGAGEEERLEHRAAVKQGSLIFSVFSSDDNIFNSTVQHFHLRPLTGDVNLKKVIVSEKSD